MEQSPGYIPYPEESGQVGFNEIGYVQPYCSPSGEIESIKASAATRGNDSGGHTDTESASWEEWEDDWQKEGH